MRFIVDHLYIFLSILFAVASQLIIKWKMSAFDLSLLFHEPMNWYKFTSVILIVCGIIIGSRGIG